MLASVVDICKRWWILALVGLLVLALTSCSGKKKTAAGSDMYYESCQGTIGSFDIYLIPTGRTSTYELVMVPFSLDAPGDIVKIALVNDAGSFRTYIQEIDLQLDQEISIGYVTDSDLYNYNGIAVVPSDPNQQFETPVSQQNEKDALCAIPIYTADGMESATY